MFDGLFVFKWLPRSPSLVSVIRFLCQMSKPDRSNDLTCSGLDVSCSAADSQGISVLPLALWAAAWSAAETFSPAQVSGPMRVKV